MNDFEEVSMRWYELHSEWSNKHARECDFNTFLVMKIMDLEETIEKPVKIGLQIPQDFILDDVLSEDIELDLINQQLEEAEKENGNENTEEGI